MWMVFETFFEDQTKTLCTGRDSYILHPTYRISCECILVYLDYTKYNKINVLFYHTQKQATNRIRYEYHL